MSKYDKLPKEELIAPAAKPSKTPISPLCCLPVILDSHPTYKQQLQAILPYEELMPLNKRKQIKQMLYMENLLSSLKEYNPDIEDSNKSPIEILLSINKSNNLKFQAKFISAISEYNKTKNISCLLDIFTSQNPMLSMLLPMLTDNGSDENLMSSLLPMLMQNGNSDMLSSIMGMM